MRPEERPFRFGVMLDTRSSTHESLVDLARRAEDAGVSVLPAPITSGAGPRSRCSRRQRP